MNATKTATRPARIATPERWAKAAERARAEGIEVRQVASTGQWVATSGTHANVAYLMEVVAGTVRACTCPAGEHGDPCCKHAAAFYLSSGLLDPEPPTPAAPAPAATCPACGGRGERMETVGWRGWEVVWHPCPRCRPAA